MTDGKSPASKQRYEFMVSKYEVLTELSTHYTEYLSVPFSRAHLLVYLQAYMSAGRTGNIKLRLDHQLFLSQTRFLQAGQKKVTTFYNKLSQINIF